MVPHRGHLMERVSASPLANNLLHSPHRISLIPFSLQVAPSPATPSSPLVPQGREQLAQAGGPALQRRASETVTIRLACSAYAALGSVISQILSSSASWSAMRPRAMASMVAIADSLTSSMARSWNNAGWRRM